MAAIIILSNLERQSRQKIRTGVEVDVASGVKGLCDPYDTSFGLEKGVGVLPISFSFVIPSSMVISNWERKRKGDFYLE